MAGDTSEALGRPLRDSWAVSGDIFDHNQPGMALGRLWGRLLEPLGPFWAIEEVFLAIDFVWKEFGGFLIPE